MQGRAAASSEHLVSAPSREERPATESESPARPSYIGNRAMAAILSRRPSAPGDQAPSSPLPADVNVGFNVMDITHRLLEAIDQSEVKWSWTGPPQRHIDYPEVVAVLKDRTPEQIAEIKQAYKDHEHRDLWEDIAGGGESHHPSDLTRDQLNRIGALLGGTVASSAENAEEAKAHRQEADAAELHELLYGDLDEPDVERVMTILRRPAEDNVLLATAYERLYVTTFATDLVKLPLPSQIRARMLVAGQSVAADAFQVGITRNQITALNVKIAELSGDSETDYYYNPVRRAQLEGLREQRQKLVADLEGRLEMTSAEARAAARGPDPTAADTAARTRVASVLGDVNAAATDIGGRDEAVIRAIAAADPGAKTAGRLRRLEAEGKLDAAAVTAALRGLRAEAEEEAGRRHPGDPGAAAIEERALADQYFGSLKTTWNAAITGLEPEFDKLLGLGDATETELNRALARGSGLADDVTELVLALRGDRKDLETVKRVLHDKSAAEITRLKVLYMMRTLGRSLDFDLFGDAPVRAGEDNPQFPGGGYLKAQGKASGTDRLILEDYLQRPSQEGGLEEVTYLVSRAEREYQYTIDNRGATGWWRDTWGNEARSLLDETIKQVRECHVQYLKLVGWTPLGTLTSPERAHSPEAHELLQKIRLARATIRGDRAAYEKATAALRAIFEMVASLVLQAALTAVLGPVAELAILGEVAEDAAVLVRVAAFARDTSVGVVSTIGANAIVYGNDYSIEMLKRDLLTGYAGAIGGKAAEKLVGPVAAGLAEQLGTKCPPEIVKLASTVGSMEAAAAAEGESLTADLNLQGIMRNHLMGKAAESVTTVTQRGFGLGGVPRPVAHEAPLAEGRPTSGEPAPEPAGTTTEPPAEGAPVPAPSAPVREPATEGVPEPATEGVPEPATGDVGERAPASRPDEPAGTVEGGRRRPRPGVERGSALGVRGGGRGRARRRQSPRSGKLGRSSRKKARTRTVRRGGGGIYIHFKSGGINYRLRVSARSEASFNAIPTGHTVVYTVHDPGGMVIYVGITTKTASRDALNRLYEHLYTKEGEFIGGADEFRIVGHYDKELEAHALEQHLVGSYDPTYNKDLTPWDTWLKGTPWAEEKKEFRPEWQSNVPKENTLIRFGVEIE